MSKRPAPIILDDDGDDRLSQREYAARELARDGFEMGLGSAILGGTFLFAGLLTPFFLGNLVHQRYREVLSPHDDGWTELFLFVCVLGAELCCIVGVILAKRGISRSLTSHSSSAIPLAGLLLSLAGIFLWLTIALFALTGNL